MTLDANELAPAIDPDLLFPPDAAFMARTDLAGVRFLGSGPLHLDSVTAHLSGLLGERPAVRHRAGTGPEILAVYRRAGLPVREETWAYATLEEAEALADRLIERGARLVWPYPLRAGRFEDAAHVVPPALYGRINAKENLASLVPAQNLPRRRVHSHAELAALEPRGPLYLKAAGEAATGMGYAVRYCPDRATFDAARSWFAERGADSPAVIVEEAVDVECCWCVGIVVGETETRCFGGAEQLFSAPACQSGSLIDPERALPPEGRSLAIQAGEAARGLGFRGLAGLDIGRARDGRMLVFDPNFRLNSSSSQLLFHPSASARAGLALSLSFDAEIRGPFADLARRLEAPIGEAWFVPLRLFNGEEHPHAEGRHRVTGMVLARDRAEAEAARRALLDRLEKGRT